MTKVSVQFYLIYLILFLSYLHIEVEEILKAGELDPDQIHTPGIYIDRIIRGKDYSRAIENLTVREKWVGIGNRCAWEHPKSWKTETM